MTKKEERSVLDYVMSDEGEKPSPSKPSFAAEDLLLKPLLNEINLISDRDIKSFTRAILVNAPSAFWYAPGSLEGEEYSVHPPDEYGEGGMVLHTKRVVNAANVLCEAVSIEDRERDVLIAAALLHDITKAVAVSETRIEFDPFHPYTVDQLVDYVHDNDLNSGTDDSSNTLMLGETEVTILLRMIRCSHGKWSPIPETLPADPLEKFLYLADYLATAVPQIIDGEDVDTDWWLWKTQKKLKKD